MNGRDEVLDALLRERYGKPTWFRSKPEDRVSGPTSKDEPSWDDSEATCARRRRELAKDFGRSYEESA